MSRNSSPERPTAILPEMSNHRIDEWLAGQEANGRRHVARLLTQFEAQQAGDIPPGTFDPDLFEKIKETTSLVVSTRKLLAGVFGSRPRENADADDEFLRIVADLHPGWAELHVPEHERARLAVQS